MEHELGTLEPEKLADPAVLDGNPLEEIANIRTVRMVMKGGLLYESAAVASGWLSAVARRFAPS